MNRPSILIADQDQAFLVSTEAWFARNGYKVTAAHAPQMAMAAIACNKFDVAVLNCSMKDTKWINLVADLASRNIFPVILYTADVSQEIKHTARTFGVYRILIKPQRLSTLESVVSLAIAKTAKEQHFVNAPKLFTTHS